MQTQIYVLNLIPTNSHVLIDRFSHTGMIAIIFNDTMIEKHGNNIHDTRLYQPSICTAGVPIYQRNTLVSHIIDIIKHNSF